MRLLTDEADEVPMLDIAYISTACNRSPLSADWNLNNEICFAAANSVAVFKTNYDGTAPKITETLTKHRSKVTSVRWVRNDITTSEDILSGSLDGTAILWSIKPHGYFIPVETFHVCNNGVAVADGRVLPHQNGGLYYYVVAASIGSLVKIWTRRLPDTFNLIQTLDLSGRLCLTLSLNSLPMTSGPMLAIAKDDNKIHLYLKKKSRFAKVDILVGHEDWVRGLDFIKSGNKLMLASCSQDSHIRLWSIESRVEADASSDDALELRIETKVFTTANHLKWAVSLNAVLSGHEGWVYGVHWNRNVNTGKLKLLSSSIDKTLIVWEPQITDKGAEGIWMEKVRVGEVGGNGLGFYGGKISPDGESIMGHGYAGSFHIWNRKEDTDNWEPSVVCGGHYNEVVDIGWEPEGHFLVSISTDQTTRIHAPWIRENFAKKTWHELARPQIHGFDMSCLAIISKYSFASGAEEKVIRTFQAPSNFVTNFHNICKTNDADSPADVLEGICEGASVPSLGLSNKAVFASDQLFTSTEDRHVKDVYPDNYFVPTELEVPPTEETLMQNTLWPEMHKLYGHGYEVFALAASSDGKLLASACKATTPQHAAIIIWDTTTWVQTQSLSSHQLTITQLSFSPDNQSLLSVSRDRRWSVFEKNAEDVFALVGTTDKKNGFHSRIIWCCAWTHDSLFFFTGSREGLIVMWGKSDSASESSTGPYSSVCPPLSLQNESVTALAIAPNVLIETYIMAAGFESGRISLFRIQKTQPGREWHLIYTMDNGTAHHLTVKRLAFRPNMNQMELTSSDMMQLASCSCDHSVKIFNIKLSYCIAHSEILEHKTNVPKLNVEI